MKARLRYFAVLPIIWLAIGALVNWSRPGVVVMHPAVVIVFWFVDAVLFMLLLLDSVGLVGRRRA